MSETKLTYSLAVAQVWRQTPSVKIQGSVNQFGYSVAAIGDVNHDGYEDMAIGSATDGNGKVYVYYGRSTATWASRPSLTASDANVTVTSDATADSKFAGANLGASLARVGDFNGDGVDDFAIGASSYSGSVGLVAIVLGNTGGLNSTISFPTAFGTTAIRIDGEATGGYLGYSVSGLGRFYGGSSGPAIVVAAPTLSGGRLYSIVGTAGSTTAISAASASNAVTGAGTEYLGIYGLNALGNVGPASQIALGVSLVFVSPVRVDLLSGTPTNGPFNSRVGITSSGATTNVYGRMIVGGGYSGRDLSYSFIGSSRSDIVVSSRANSTPRLYIADGDRNLLSSSATIESIADVVVPLTGSYADFSTNVTAIPDLDGDGYGDLLVAETDYSASPVSGHVLILR